MNIQKNLMSEIHSITLRQLRAVQAVSETGSITAAARALGLTPPAVHTQVRSLEAILGCPVMERSEKGGMALTAEGRLILQAQHSIEVNLKSCLNRIEAMKKGLAGQVVLGVVSTGKYFAPALVAGLKKSFADIDVQLRIGNRGEIVKALNERSIDIAIMGRPPRFPAVRSVNIGVHPMIMIAAPANRLAQMDFVAPDDLLDEVIISRERGSGTRILMIRYLDRIGEGRPYEVVTMGSNETIKQAVMAGLGIAMISQHTVTEELKAGRLVAIRSAELPIERQWYVLHLREAELSPAMRTVWDFINANARGYFPSMDG